MTVKWKYDENERGPESGECVSRFGDYADGNHSTYSQYEALRRARAVIERATT